MNVAVMGRHRDPLSPLETVVQPKPSVTVKADETL